MLKFRLVKDRDGDNRTNNKIENGYLEFYFVDKNKVIKFKHEDIFINKEKQKLITNNVSMNLNESYFLHNEEKEISIKMLNSKLRTILFDIKKQEQFDYIIKADIAYCKPINEILAYLTGVFDNFNYKYIITEEELQRLNQTIIFKNEENNDNLFIKDTEKFERFSALNAEKENLYADLNKHFTNTKDEHNLKWLNDTNNLYLNVVNKYKELRADLEKYDKDLYEKKHR